MEGKLDRSRYKVFVDGKKQAKQFRQALLAVGEKVSGLFYLNTKEHDTQHELSFDNVEWVCDWLVDAEEITFKELIALIVNENTEVAPEVKPGLLEGKCQIQINNDREYKLANEHLKDNGFNYEQIPMPWTFPMFMCYQKLIHFSSESIDGYSIIPFKDFAQEVNIKVPVFVMKSMEGTNLYEGDPYFHAYLSDGKDSKWLEGHTSGSDGINKGTHAISDPENVKAFATKEAREKWVIEANKPKEIVLEFEEGMARVTSAEVELIMPGTNSIIFSGDELKRINDAFNQLQPF